MNWSYLLFSFDGRIGRQTFWMAFLAVAGLELLCHLFVSSFDNSDRLSAIISLAFAYPEFAVFAKRGHDRNIPPLVIGVFFLLSVSIDFIVVLGFGAGREQVGGVLFTLGFVCMLFAVALLIELGMRRGTVGPNRYGPDPLV